MSIPTQTSIPEAIQMVNEVFGLTSLDIQGISSTQVLPKEQEQTTPRFYSTQWDTKDWREAIAKALYGDPELSRGRNSKANKWVQCHKKGIVLTCAENSNHKFYVPYRCDLRICPTCGRRYARKILSRYKDPLGKLAQKGRKSRKNLKFLTLTKKKGNALITPESVRDFNKAVAKIIRKYFDGALTVVEVGSRFNLHAHCIVYGPYVPQEKLSNTWLKITGDSPVVDVRQVKSYKRPLSYIVKYISKPCQFSRPGDYVVYLKAIHGTRRVHSYGVLYGVKHEEETTTERHKRCPYCGGELHYDRTTSETYGIDLLHRYIAQPYWIARNRAKQQEDQSYVKRAALEAVSEKEGGNEKRKTKASIFPLPALQQETFYQGFPQRQALLHLQ